MRSFTCRPRAVLHLQSKRRLGALGISALAFGFLGLVSCGDDDRAGLAGSGDQGPIVVPDKCASPNEGCECSDLGQAVECEEPVRRIGDFVLCSVGTRACGADGTWGACIESQQRTQYMPESAWLRVQALGMGQNCNNECDPRCTEIIDTPEGLTDDPMDDVDVNDDGVTLNQVASGSMGSSCTGLAISPDPATLTVTSMYPLSPNTIDFTASLTPPGCYSGEPDVLWSITPYDIATIGTNGTVTLVTPIAGPITVTAYAGSLSAAATLNIRVDVTEMPASPTAAQTALQPLNPTGAGADALTVLYPYPSTVFPLGLLPPLIQWRPTASASAVKVTLRYPSTGTTIFRWSKVQAENETLLLNPGHAAAESDINLAGGPRFTIPTSPSDVWFAFEQTVNRNRSTAAYAPGDTAQFVVQRYTSSIRTEVATPIKFASGQLKGTVYYQSYATNLAKNWGDTFASQTIGASARFGAATLSLRPGDTYPTVAAGYANASNTGGCRVCHSVNANGTVLVTNLHSSDAAASGEPGSTKSSRFLLGTDLPNGGTVFPSPNPNNGRFSFPALYTDGSFILSNAGPPRDFRNTAVPGGLDGSYDGADSAFYRVTGGTLGGTLTSSGIPAGNKFATPVFSGDGTKVAFNHYAGTLSTYTGDKYSLAVMNFADGATKALSGYVRVTNNTAQCTTTSWGGVTTTDKCLDVWPSFMPSNAGLVFERELFNNGRVAIKDSQLTAAGTANPRAYLDFGGTRAGCSGTNMSSHCGNQGTRAELWWVPVTGGTAAKLTLANNGWATGTLLTHTGDRDGVCETGENCMEANWIAGGDDDWICEAGETCAEYNKLCQERNSAAGGNDNSICEPGETCLDSGGGDWAPGEVCTQVSGDDDGSCEAGERCAEAPNGHTSNDEPYLNYEPSLNPQAVGGYYWAAFTSRRLYGNVATMNPWWSDPRDRPLGGQWGPTTKKIWVTAINQGPTAGSDPSNPPFYLPGQEYLAGNSKAFWVLDACTAPSATRSLATQCDSDLDCCSGSCMLDPASVSPGPATSNCMPAVGAGCIDDGSTTQCTTDAECCDFPPSRCVAGTCTAPPPLLIYTEGDFVRTFQAECASDQEPVWQLFQWQAELPTGTSVEFTAASDWELDVLDAIPLTSYVAVGTALPPDTTDWTDDGISIYDALRAGNLPSGDYLRVNMHLNPSSDQTVAPNLTDWRVMYTCVDAQ